MTQKQLIVLILIITTTFLALFAGAGYLYLYQPEILGIQRPVTLVPEDSLPQLSDPLLREANDLHVMNAKLEEKISHANDSLQRTMTKVQELAKQAEQFKKQIEKVKEEEKKRKVTVAAKPPDTTSLKNAQAFAEMYEKAQPAEVAKILSEADVNFAAKVLHRMKRKSAAKIIEQLPVKRAVAIASVKE